MKLPKAIEEAGSRCFGAVLAKLKTCHSMAGSSRKSRAFARFPPSPVRGGGNGPNLGARDRDDHTCGRAFEQFFFGARGGIGTSGYDVRINDPL